MLAQLQCSRLHVYREKPLYASGYLGSIEVQPGEALDFDSIASEWGGGTLRFRPLKSSGHFAKGSKTYKFSGAPKYQGREIRPDGQMRERPHNAAVPPVPGAAQHTASMVRAAIPRSSDPAVNALADIVLAMLQKEAGSAGADPATQLGAYVKSLEQVNKLMNPDDPDDDDDGDDGGGMDPSMLMMMMMMNQGGGGPGGPNPMMMMLPQLMKGRGGGGGPLGGLDPMMLMMMMNQGGGMPGQMPTMPQQQVPQGWPQQQAPQQPWPQQAPQQQQPPQQPPAGMNPAMMAWFMAQQQQAQQQQRRRPQPQQPPQPSQQAWTPPPDPGIEDEPETGADGPHLVDDEQRDPYQF